MSDIAGLIPRAPHHLFETYFHFFFRTYKFEQRSGERNILPYFYFSTPEEQSCIVESCITERLTTRTIYYITEYIPDPNESRIFFFYFFPRALLFFLKNFVAIAVIGSSLSRIISLFHKGEHKKRRNIMPQLETPVHHCFQSFRVLDDKKKNT